MNLTKLMENLGYRYKDANLLKIALTHRSYLNETHMKNLQHNERFEFLGDAVLELIVTKYLFNNQPSRAEGELTSFRAAIVRTESLADMSTKLEVGKYIFMSKGEEATGGRERQYILANTFEAILGSIYLDGGLEPCERLVYEKLMPKLPEIVENRLDIDAKSKLQEITQDLYKYTPTYEVVEEKGPDHDRVFTVKVIVKDKSYGTGTGKSKQEAEQNAAQSALKKIKKNLI